MFSRDSGLPAPGEGAKRLLGSCRARLEKKFDTAWVALAAREGKSYFPETPRSSAFTSSWRRTATIRKFGPAR
jgi:hypothetical protein